MTVTYIHHSSFVIEEQLQNGHQLVLLFDYFEGTLPEFSPEAYLYVFASHKHADHFNLCIFDLLKTYRNVTYVLGNDIKLNEKYLERNGIAAEVKEHILSVKSHMTIEAGDIVIETLRSTDQGVAFVVSFEDKTVYHAGDLNWWHWKGYTDQGNRLMAKRYQEEIDLLKGRHFDVAFVPTDPRLEEFYDLGLRYFMEQTKTDIIYPMHLWEHYEIAEALAAAYAGVKNPLCIKIM